VQAFQAFLNSGGRIPVGASEQLASMHANKLHSAHGLAAACWVVVGLVAACMLLEVVSGSHKP
jgi:hypothetical protein